MNPNPFNSIHFNSFMKSCTMHIQYSNTQDIYNIIQDIYDS